MMNEHLVMVIGMALVTYLPRMVPMVVLPGLELPSFLERFLGFVPVAVLTALLFPGILESTGRPMTAAVGGMVALVLAWREYNLMVVVLVSILAVFLVAGI
ncbi:MAG: AzlD domain-containing protein [Halanaerobiales bacterium]